MNFRTRLTALSVVATICATPAFAESSGSDTWVIGQIGPTTGPLASIGLRAKSSLEFWEKNVNAAGGIRGRRVQIQFCNDEGQPEKGVACARDLLQKGAVLINNSSITGSVRATMALLADGPTMLISTPNIVPSPGSFVYQTPPSTAVMEMGTARLLKRAKLTKVGMIATSEASGDAAVNAVKAVYPKEGIDVQIARIDLRAIDATTQLARIAEDADVIYSSYTGAGAGIVIKSYTNLGLTKPVLVGFGTSTIDFLDAIRGEVPKALLGLTLRAVSPELADDYAGRSRAMEFKRSFEAATGEKVEQATAVAKLNADTIEAILRNVDNPTDPRAVRSFLYSKPIESIDTVKYTPDNHVGTLPGALIFIQERNGAWGKSTIGH